MKKPTSRKPSPKATKCWAVIYRDGHIDAWLERVIAECNQGVGRTLPAWLLTQEQIPAVIEAMARVLAENDESSGLTEGIWSWETEFDYIKNGYRKVARAALRAAGVGVK